MIRHDNGLFVLDTDNTTYAFEVIKTGQLKHLYYGSGVDINKDNCSIFENKYKYPSGNMISYSGGAPEVTLENMCLEMSEYGKGDIREPFIMTQMSDGSFTSDFVYESFEIVDGHRELEGLPSSYGYGDTKQLTVIMRANNFNSHLEIVYTVYEHCDCITRSARFVNDDESETVKLDRLMSLQLDLDCAGEKEYDFINFSGAWIREMNLNKTPCFNGKLINSSITGISGNRNNPFVMIAEKSCNENAGECFGFNLIYSGNHYECAQKDAFDNVRVVAGINPEMFSFNIKPGESFQSPEAVMTFSGKGFNLLSHRMHAFVRNHIVRGTWKDKTRPVLINSWEAAYFKFDDKKLLKLAKSAKDVGVELFVLDDGWFGNRNDDKSSLGDWKCNENKIKGGLKKFSHEIRKLGMNFGIWVEPEMINVDSECYRSHPDWAVSIPGKSHSEGRNQRILDLTRSDVRDYVVKSMSEVFLSADICYVKWDMNRIFSDVYGSRLDNQKEFYHRYILGFYDIARRLTSQFEDILFEGCASGGNRFDLGMLCFFPQIWASDNTDAWCRANIQKGYSYGYPMSVITTHISDSPNHQTLRNTLLETRYNIAVSGLLGIECNVSEMSAEEKSTLKAMISEYKHIRGWLMTSEYYRLSGMKNMGWMCVSKDKKNALAAQMQATATANYPNASIQLMGLEESYMYHFYNIEKKYNVKLFGSLINAVSPVHVKKDSLLHNTIAKVIKMDGEKEDYTASGQLFNICPIHLKQNYVATGFDGDVRYYQDFASRLYLIEACGMSKNTQVL